MCFDRPTLRSAATGNPKLFGLLMRQGRVNGAGNICFAEPDWRELVKAHPPLKGMKSVVSAAMRPAPWPDWAHTLARAALPGEAGLGDVVARAVGSFDSQSFRIWYAETVGVFEPTCHCETWQPLWNKLYPLPA